jgi:hypothetical protein
MTISIPISIWISMGIRLSGAVTEFRTKQGMLPGRVSETFPATKTLRPFGSADADLSQLPICSD